LQHDADHGHLNEGGSDAAVALEVAGETAVAADPADGALDDPALRQHDDPVDTAAIVQGWTELVRVKASIEAGAVAPSVILRRLAAASAPPAGARHRISPLGRYAASAARSRCSSLPEVVPAT
jgi:hypothetical protein